MASAMCTVETVNGREYKVRDMAMADFGCVSDPPDEELIFRDTRFSAASARSPLRDRRFVARAARARFEPSRATIARATIPPMQALV